MTDIAARPTVYRGVLMRSRLEAWFAGWMDSEGFDWQYEPRAYAGHGGQYLPDFHVDAFGFVELKHENADALEALARMHIIRESEPNARLSVLRVGFPYGETTISVAECWPGKRLCASCEVVR